MALVTYFVTDNLCSVVYDVIRSKHAFTILHNGQLYQESVQFRLFVTYECSKCSLDAKHYARKSERIIE